MPKIIKCEASLYELPICPEEGEDNEMGMSITTRSYVEELERISNPEDLKRFTKRWKSVWLLALPGRILNEEEIKIVKNDYDAEEALVCIKENRNEESCKHIRAKSPFGCPGVHIMLPLPFMQITLIADKYEAPESLVFHKLCGKYSSNVKLLRRIKAFERLQRIQKKYASEVIKS